MSNQKLRAAVIGVGYLGRFHAQKYAALPDVEAVPRGRHEAELAALLEEMTSVRRSAPPGAQW